MPEEALNGDLRVRCDEQEIEIFKAKAKRVTGKHYSLLVREMITAFNDDKLRIIPTEEYQAGKLYSKF